MRQYIGCNSASIGYFQCNAIPAGFFESNPDRRIRVAVFEGVADQIRCHLRDAFRIPETRAISDITRLDEPRRRRRLMFPDDSLDQRLEIRRLALDDDASRQ